MKRFIAVLLVLAFAGSARAQIITDPPSGASGTTVSITTLANATYCADVGGTDAYACSFTPAPASLAAMLGAVVTFKAPTVNTGAATFAPNGFAATPIVKVGQTITTALVTNDIRAGSYVTAVYDGTSFVCLSCDGNRAGLSTASTWTATQSFGDLSTSSSATIATNAFLALGAASGDALIWNLSAQTPDAPAITTGTTAEAIKIFQRGDTGTDFQNACTEGYGTVACANPTLEIYAAAADAQSAISFAHDGKAGVITGGDSVSLNGTLRIGGRVALSAGAATTVVTIPTANNTSTGGIIDYTVDAGDGTNSQSRSGTVRYSVATNNAAAETCVVYGVDLTATGGAGPTLNPNQTQDGSGAGAMTAGTMTYDWSVDVTGTNTCVLKLNAASSLTETRLNIHYTVRNNGPGVPTGGD